MRIGEKCWHLPHFRDVKQTHTFGINIGNTTNNDHLPILLILWLCLHLFLKDQEQGQVLKFLSCMFTTTMVAHCGLISDSEAKAAAVFQWQYLLGVQLRANMQVTQSKNVARISYDVPLTDKQRVTTVWEKYPTFLIKTQTEQAAFIWLSCQNCICIESQTPKHLVRKRADLLISSDLTWGKDLHISAYSSVFPTCYSNYNRSVHLWEKLLQFLCKWS